MFASAAGTLSRDATTIDILTVLYNFIDRSLSQCHIDMLSAIQIVIGSDMKSGNELCHGKTCK